MVDIYGSTGIYIFISALRKKKQIIHIYYVYFFNNTLALGIFGERNYIRSYLELQINEPQCAHRSTMVVLARNVLFNEE